ncbi:AfsR/SARP family transcriptional regulator [Streptomyces sp. AC512_CC834]|uniref:AfsR/SARP family transcriptional regulator n=1 Tax=Streptomyces sp. AC512_CC834 TaxID=2823691 RepID=UPI001C263592|nr:AfsR/SARP family transcriptional regulator [Streptomyces sp. AC512_CC834]
MEHPFRERMWARLMLALYRCGRRADALRAYLQVRDVLAEETGLEPGQKLRDLHRTILGEDPASEPGVEPGMQPGVEPGVEPAVDPVSEATVEPAVEPASAPASEPASAPASVTARAAGEPEARNANNARLLPPALGDFSGQQAEPAGMVAVLRTGVILIGGLPGKCDSETAPREFTAKGASYETCSLSATKTSPVTAASFDEGDAYSDSPVIWTD